MIRTLLADSDSIARQGIRAVLGKRDMPADFDEAGSSAELIARLFARYYELIVIDPAVWEGSPESCIAQLRQSAPWSAVLVFTRLDELTYGRDAIRGGAKGYVMKNCDADQLHAAVDRVASGKVYLSRALAADFVAGIRQYDSRIKPHEALSKREFQVFSMAVCGMTAVESASVLLVDLENIKAFKASVMAKLHVSSLAGMVDYAVSQGVMDDCRRMSSRLWTSRHCGEDPAWSEARAG